eukprot:5561621-Amphidinium_carterae.3
MTSELADGSGSAMCDVLRSTASSLGSGAGVQRGGFICSFHFQRYEHRAHLRNVPCLPALYRLSVPLGCSH